MIAERDERRWAACIHEGAHATACFALGVPVQVMRLHETVPVGKAALSTAAIIGVAGAAGSMLAGLPPQHHGLSASDRAMADGVPIGPAMLAARRILRSQEQAWLAFTRCLYASRLNEVDATTLRAVWFANCSPDTPPERIGLSA